MDSEFHHLLPQGYEDYFEVDVNNNNVAKRGIFDATILVDIPSHNTLHNFIRGSDYLRELRDNIYKTAKDLRDTKDKFYTQTVILQLEWLLKNNKEALKEWIKSTKEYNVGVFDEDNYSLSTLTDIKKWINDNSSEINDTN